LFGGLIQEHFGFWITLLRDNVGGGALKNLHPKQLGPNSVACWWSNNSV